MYKDMSGQKGGGLISKLLTYAFPCWYSHKFYAATTIQSHLMCVYVAFSDIVYFRIMASFTARPHIMLYHNCKSPLIICLCSETGIFEILLVSPHIIPAHYSFTESHTPHSVYFHLHYRSCPMLLTDHNTTKNFICFIKLLID